MRHYNIRTKVTILFIVVFVLVCVLFITSLSLESDVRYQERALRQENIIHTLIDDYEAQKQDMDLLNYLVNNHFAIVKNSDFANNVKTQGDKIFKISTKFGTFSSISYNNELFLYVKSRNYDVILQSEKENVTFEFIVFGFIISLCLSFILYFSIINSLNPLKRLREEVAQSAEGKPFSASIYQDDEVGKIAVEFEKTLIKNKQLVESRQLFLRTIMHELKTPIGKGMLVAEMMKEQKQRQRLMQIFKRLDSLINESARIESLFSRNYNLHIAPYSFSKIIEQTKKYLMNDEFDERISLRCEEDLSFEVDIEMFALVLKNLIDNAIKYSPDNRCKIECKGHFICISNKGERLKQDISAYMQAFARDKDNKIAGMGLGLYIVERICVMHGFILEYNYTQNRHNFIIKDGKNEREI